MLIDHLINILNKPRVLAKSTGIIYKLGDAWDDIIDKNYNRFSGHCHDLARVLPQIPKFVFTDDFARLTCDIADADPLTLHRLLATARPPFETCWLEWKSKIAAHDGLQIRAGALIVPHDSAPDAYNIIQVLANENDQADSVIIVPGALGVNFITTVPEDKDEDQFDIGCVFTAEYLERWRNQMPVLKALGQHASAVIGPPPYEELTRQIPITGQDVVDALSQILHDSACLFREIVAGLALMATHIGGGPIVQQQRAKTKGHYSRGKIRPGFEYQIVELIRPMTAPWVVNEAYPAPPRAPAAYHPVIGAWHHRRTAVANCQLHPRACPLANWVPIWGDDGKPVGSQQQTCAICHRHRWFVPGHHRGDPQVGGLDRDYRIVTAKDGAAQRRH
jgi:hypothetical protein